MTGDRRVCAGRRHPKVPRHRRARTAFLFGALQSLNADLEKHGGRLILRYGSSPDRELRALAAETGATALYFNRDYTPYSTDRDEKVTAMLDAAGVDVISYDDALLAPRRTS